jgi:hypothetical protein
MVAFVTNWDQIQIQKCSSVLNFYNIPPQSSKMSFSFELGFWKRSSKMNPLSHNPFYKPAFPQNALLPTLVLNDSAIPKNGEQLQLSFGCIWDLFWSQCNI